MRRHGHEQRTAPARLSTRAASCAAPAAAAAPRATGRPRRKGKSGSRSPIKAAAATARTRGHAVQQPRAWTASSSWSNLRIVSLQPQADDGGRASPVPSAHQDRHTGAEAARALSPPSTPQRPTLCRPPPTQPPGPRLPGQRAALVPARQGQVRAERTPPTRPAGGRVHPRLTAPDFSSGTARRAAADHPAAASAKRPTPSAGAENVSGGAGDGGGRRQAVPQRPASTTTSTGQAEHQRQRSRHGPRDHGALRFAGVADLRRHHLRINLLREGAHLHHVRDGDFRGGLEADPQPPRRRSRRWPAAA